MAGFEELLLHIYTVSTSKGGIRYSSCRYNERQLIDVTVVRRVRPLAERWCDCEGHRRWKRAGRTLFCNGFGHWLPATALKTPMSVYLTFLCISSLAQPSFSSGVSGSKFARSLRFRAASLSRLALSASLAACRAAAVRSLSAARLRCGVREI